MRHYNQPFSPITGSICQSEAFMQNDQRSGLLLSPHIRSPSRASLPEDSTALDEGEEDEFENVKQSPTRQLSEEPEI